MLITGASRGFGAEAARELARRGNTVVATMRTPERDAPAVVAGFEDLIHPVRLDVTIPAEVTAVVAGAIERHGRIDALVNNAGYGLWGPIEALSEEELRRQFDTNFLGQWRMVHAVAPHLRAQRWGKIVNVSSLSGRVPSPMLAPYAASKHAVEALTEGLREELVAWGVSATALEPGMYASDWQTAGLDVSEEIRTGRSPYTAPTRRALDGFRRLAATRPGSDAVAAAIADIVQLQQPPPLRWPVGEDCVRMLRDRARLTDDDWERLMRGQGWGLAPGDVDDARRRRRRPTGRRGPWSVSPPTPDPLFAEPRLARDLRRVGGRARRPRRLRGARGRARRPVSARRRLRHRHVRLPAGCCWPRRRRRRSGRGLARRRPGQAGRRRRSMGARRRQRRPALQVDLATMTGNVAMVFTADDDWAATDRGRPRAAAPRWVVRVRDAHPGAPGVAGVDADRDVRSGSTCPASARSPTGSRSSTCACRS